MPCWILRFLCLAAFAFTSFRTSAQPPKPLQARVNNHNGRPTLFINNQPQFPMLYALTETPGGRWTWEERPAWNIQQFSERGVKLFEFDIWMEHLWKENGTLDIEMARKQIRGALAIRPDAAIMLRLHVNAPRWWNKAHPAECVQFANGPIDSVSPWGIHNPLEWDLDRSVRHSLASDVWRKEATAKTIEFCQQLAKTPEGNAIFGIHVAGGVYGEWHYFGFAKNDPDTGPAMTNHFRAWLKTKYKTDAALRAAWNDPKISFDNITVPNTQERLFTSNGYFRDPLKEQKVIDYFRCQHERVTDTFIHFCKTVKENWPRPLIVGGFHGYWFTMFGRMASGGHLGIEKALNSPYIDFLSAPQSYDHRHIGQAGHSRGIIESALLHNKLWFDEMDHAPFIEEQKDPDRKISLANSISILRRSVAAPFSRGTGMWYYDYGPNKASGWWDNPDILAEVKRLHELHEKYFPKPYQPDNDVLVVYDTESFYYTGNTKDIDPISTEMLDWTTEDLFHSGAAFDMIYLFDLERVNLQRYKAVIFMNVFHLSDKQREFIQNKVMRDGRHIIWQSAPGYFSGNKASVAAMSKIVGMELTATQIPKPRITIQQPDWNNASFGFEKITNPVFAVTDAKVEAFGRFENSQLIGLAKKNLANSTAWFAALPLRNAAVLRQILRAAGAHIFAEQNDVIYNGGGILTVHSLQGGKRNIKLRNGRSLEIEIPVRGTLLLDNVTGENLLP